MTAKQIIENGKAILGIEFGSTRIKAVLINPDHKVIAQGSHNWENQLVDGLWTYSLEAIWFGLQDCYANLRREVREKYDTEIEILASIGISAMMHGYMAFNEKNEILVPFRTWRNTNTGKAAKELSDLFVYNIPLRWSISHLYEAILDNEEHIKDIKFQTTLAGYIHWQLTGCKVLGIGDASGMMPVDPETKTYNSAMVEKFNKLIAPCGFGWTILDIFPKVLVAGENAGFLTPEGAHKLDISGHLKAGIPLCPPEGDAGTGMAATNAVKQRTGNVSAGTSSFSMIVLEKDLSKPYEPIDIVTTPDGSLVAMVHCNNCTSDINAWVKKNTDDMIPTLLEEISPEAMMYLINAVAFDAKWATPYEEYQISDGDFTAADGTAQTVPMMHSTERNFLSDAHARGFLKYYEQGYAFAALLPEEGLSPEDYLAALTADSLQEMLWNPEDCEVCAALPQYAYDYNTELSAMLKRMGMATAFTDDADFSQITTDLPLYISRVQHKTHIEVNSAGTKAAAVTSVEIRCGSAIMEEERVEVVTLDRPFLYLILDTKNKLPVFIGIVNTIEN